MKFSKVGTVDFYRAYDGLDGYKLIEGEAIEVKFPNGKIETYSVRLEKGTGEEFIDMNGHPDIFPTSQAYIDIWNKSLGLYTKVYLRNKDLEVRRINKPLGKKARFWHDGKEYKW